VTARLPPLPDEQVTPAAGDRHRTVVVTGSASGIGAAVKDQLEGSGCRVIGADLRDADIEADLATAEGRRALIAAVRAHSPSGIDGIVANAGVNRTDSLAIRVNYFGAIATLDGLRPLLRQPSPRAVLMASRALLQPVNDTIVDACLSGDEDRAVRLADNLGDGGVLYATSKRAAARWIRRVAASSEWAGAGIPLNAVAPGSVSTPMIAHRTAEEQQRRLLERPMPLGGVAEAHEVATVIRWFLEPTNTKVTGQVLFVDGGGELLMRGDDIWDAMR
jgi:NAD(P)-dependent dehydrogenase (short-subunit alcohol dehydrogenase family)